jgi:Asp-tRNA(Asn)/Glu-tRNA(Gln) amidotransferase A subunit family amidase
MDVCDLSATELAAALRRRELTPLDALEAVLERADAITDEVNPYALRLDEHARAAATATGEMLSRGAGGPLTGVPVTVKDSHYMAGIPTMHASLAVEPYVPTETVAAVERLEAAGAVVYAKTTTPEFCYFGYTESERHGRTANPHDVTRTAGGSSGGAAAALAAGAGPLALGGDGGGSIRIPAAFCGVVGFKPSFGAVPREPSGASWKTLVAYGPLARTVADARLMFDVMAGSHARDRHSIDVATRGHVPARMYVSEDLGFAHVDDDVRDTFRAVVATLDDVELEDAPAFPPSAETWFTIATAEAYVADAVAGGFGDAGLGTAPAGGTTAAPDGAGLGAPAREFLTAGAHVTAERYVAAQIERERVFRRYADLLAGGAVLLTPTLGIEAFAALPDHDWGSFLYDANLAGLPACALPMGLGDEGLPLSLQIIGARGADGAVLAAAQHIEERINDRAPARRR